MATSTATRAAINEAFDLDPLLCQRILTLTDDKRLTPLLHDIAGYILLLRRTHSNPDTPETGKRSLEDTLNGSEPASKRRKPGGPVEVKEETSSTRPVAWLNQDAAFVAPDVSFAVPVRKKLRVEVVACGKGGGGGIRGVDVKTGAAEVAVAWVDIDQIISVPVPEKATPAYHFIIITTPSPTSISSTSPTHEPIVFTVPATPAKITTLPGLDIREGETFEALMRRVLDQELERAKGKGARVVLPDAREFVSGVVQAHRKGEKAWHVKAWRGSKDGFLYLLPTGILSGFRKPILFLPFHAITSISYTSILQRTFNLNISFVSPASDTPEDLEFAMLDQADFAGIDAFVKRHGLHDASLAEGRRARFYGVNEKGGRRGANGGSVDGGVGDVDEGEDEGEGDADEVARRERELQDAEDEQEEDYDPSGGESEGSGSDSEEEDGEQGDGDGGEGDEELETDEEAEEELGGYEDEDDGGGE